MPLSSNFAVYVPIATGAIDEKFAQNELYDSRDVSYVIIPSGMPG